MRTVAIIQARMGSTRLPGKVLMRLGRRPVLEHVARRAAASPLISAVVVATTTSALDNAVATEAVRCGAGIYRGSEHDVLQRYCEAAVAFAAEIIVRVTADCPLLDSGLLTAMLEKFLASRRCGAQLDYLSNTLVRSFPRGLDVEIFTKAALDAAAREAVEPHEREHVTPFIYEHPERFALANHTGPVDRSKYRLTLDTPEDFELLSAIFRELGGAKEVVETADVIELLDRRPDLAALNAGVAQKALG